MNFISDLSLTQNVFNNIGYVRYVYPKGKIKPSFQLGGFVNYFFKTDYSRYLEVINDLGNTYHTGYENDNPFSKLDFGVSIGAGICLNYLKNNVLFIDFRYQRGFGWLDALNSNTFVINADFQIGK